MKKLKKGKAIRFRDAIGHPYPSLDQLPAGKWHVQALYDTNTIASDINAEGNFYGEIQTIDIPASEKLRLSLNLTAQIPPEQLPENGPNLHYFT